MASNKLTFDFGQPPNFDGLAEQKLIAHSVNVESLADGSGVRTRSGMRHAYQFRQYTDQTSDSTQIISGLRTPNAENINSNELGIDIIYAVDDNGKYIIKDMKQTTFVQTEDQYVTFTHVKDPYISYPQIFGYTEDNKNYYLMFNRLSGDKPVIVYYCIGLITYEGETVSYNKSVFCYDKMPSYENTNDSHVIKGTLILNTTSGELIESINTYSIVGSAVLNPQDAFVKIPLTLAQYKANGDGEYLAELPIVLSFSYNDSNGVSQSGYVKTSDLKIYVVPLSMKTVTPIISTYPSGQSGKISFKRYPNKFEEYMEGGA